MRNENGFGSIVCLDKTGTKRRKPWAVRVTVGWENGKQVRKYLGYYPTQKEALMALAEYHNKGFDIDFSKLTIEELYDLWIKRIEKKASDNSLATHHMMYKRLGILARQKVSKIKSTHLQDWLDALPLKPSTKGKMKSSMQLMFDFAVANDIVNKNYASHITVGEKIESSGAIFTENEIKVLWENSHMEYVQDILILIYTSMRIGEAMLITKENVNLEEGYMIGGIKSDNGRNRVIPIHNAIMPFIEERMARGNYILYSRNGTPPKYTTMKTRFEKTLQKFGMTHKLHDTRKTGISLLSTAGVPMEAVRIIAGHSGKGVTEKVYLYKEPKELVELVNKIKIL